MDDGLEGIDFNDNSYEGLNEYKPQNEGYDVFNLRTNTDQLLEDFELKLRNKIKRKNKDGHIIIEQIKGTAPLCNEQGIQGIMGELKNLINNHIVQWNAPSMNDLLRERLNIGENIITSFWINRKVWQLSYNDTYRVVNMATNLINLFLTRGLNNQERVLYGETYKENISRTVGNEPKKNNVLKDMSRFFGK